MCRTIYTTMLFNSDILEKLYINLQAKHSSALGDIAVRWLNHRPLTARGTWLWPDKSMLKLIGKVVGWQTPG